MRCSEYDRTLLPVEYCTINMTIITLIPNQRLKQALIFVRWPLASHLQHGFVVASLNLSGRVLGALGACVMDGRVCHELMTAHGRARPTLTRPSGRPLFQQHERWRVLA